MADCPGYTDCYLRLACVSRAKGDHTSAVAWAQKAVEFESGHADAHALMAELHMERREWDKADVVRICHVQHDNDEVSRHVPLHM